MNTNPNLIMGLAMSHAAKVAGELTPGDRQYGELRVYPNNGMGWFFIRASSPGRWYWMDEPGADHFNRAEQSEVETAIAAGARVQLVGSHARSLAIWRTWAEFEKAIE